MVERKEWSGHSEKMELYAVEAVKSWMRVEGIRGLLVLVCDSVR